MSVTISGSGQIIKQVITTQLTAAVTVSTPSNLTWYDVPGFTVSITPTNASNKVLFMGQITAAVNTSTSDRTYVRLVRNGTIIDVGDALGSMLQGSGQVWVSADATGVMTYNLQWLDSPATTSAVTYKIQTATNSGGGTNYFNRSSGSTATTQNLTTASQLMAMEVAYA